MRGFSDAPGRDVPKRKVCANCRQDYIDGDQYCRFCGAPMGGPAFITDTFATLYGPEPTRRLHKCKQCGCQWETKSINDEQRYCPKCGGDAPVIEEGLFSGIPDEIISKVTRDLELLLRLR